ncbi:MAG: DUF2782 domain-containing protein [Gammaproteobacteria bacterium]|nr:DUF2782 domain-containing protein [Gammaproteobacteria bacterium]MDE0450531.1 DUF2782 domain-containing protein [Gammaproteobacteria bacterium]
MRPRRIIPIAIVAMLAASANAAEERRREHRGPDVTLIETEERVVYEYRQNGLLRMIKIVPKRGKPYYLVPRDPGKGLGTVEEADVLLPQWEIVRF